MKEKVVAQLSNFVIRRGDTLPARYYKVSTTSLFISWTVYPETFLYKLIHDYLGGSNQKDEEYTKLVELYLTAMMYVSTVNDSNLITLVFRYIDRLNKAIEAGEDIDISQAKAAYYIDKMFDDMFSDTDNKKKVEVKDGK